MREEKKVTIVIPVYNVEKYLDRCVKSAIGQTYRNLEIILVDDGSPDACPILCDKWAKMDKRIKVIHKKNQGLGMARNTGMENASGEYICFLDSDDLIEKDMVEKCMASALEDHADMVCFGFKRFDKEMRIKKIVAAHFPGIYAERQIEAEFIPGMIAPDPVSGKSIGIWMNIWSGFYSMRYLKKIAWKCASERDIISEDVYSLLLLYKGLTCVSVLPHTFYHYFENPESLTHIYRKDRFVRIKDFYYKCLKLCDELDYPTEIKRRLAGPFINFTIAAIKQIASSKERYGVKRTLIREIVQDEGLHAALTSYRGPDKKIAHRILVYLMKKRSVGPIIFLAVLKVSACSRYQGSWIKKA